MLNRVKLDGDQGPPMRMLFEVKTLFIKSGSPWENGYTESFNGKLCDEPLNGEIFETMLVAKMLIERWRNTCPTICPHSAMGYLPPAPEAVQSHHPASATLQLGAAGGGLMDSLI